MGPEVSCRCRRSGRIPVPSRRQASGHGLCSGQPLRAGHGGGRPHRAGRFRGTSRLAKAPLGLRATASACSHARSGAGCHRHRRFQTGAGCLRCLRPICRGSEQTSGSVSRHFQPCRQIGSERVCHVPDHSDPRLPRGSCAPEGAFSTSPSSSHDTRAASPHPRRWPNLMARCGGGDHALGPFSQFDPISSGRSTHLNAASRRSGILPG